MSYCKCVATFSLSAALGFSFLLFFSCYKHCCCCCSYFWNFIQIVCLIQTAAAQIIGDNDIGNSIENKLYIICICGARHVAVDFLWGWFVFRFELSLNVCSSFTVFLTSWNMVRKKKCIKIYIESLVKFETPEGLNKFYYHYKNTI